MINFRMFDSTRSQAYIPLIAFFRLPWTLSSAPHSTAASKCLLNFNLVVKSKSVKSSQVKLMFYIWHCSYAAHFVALLYFTVISFLRLSVRKHFPFRRSSATRREFHFSINSWISYWVIELLLWLKQSRRVWITTDPSRSKSWIKVRFREWQFDIWFSS